MSVFGYYMLITAESVAIKLYKLSRQTAVCIKTCLLIRNCARLPSSCIRNPKKPCCVITCEKRKFADLCPCCVLIAWQSPDSEIKIDFVERLQPTFWNQIRLQYLILPRTCVQTWCNLID